MVTVHSTLYQLAYSPPTVQKWSRRESMLVAFQNRSIRGTQMLAMGTCLKRPQRGTHP